jgi:hypothetical protein
MKQRVMKRRVRYYYKTSEPWCTWPKTNILLSFLMQKKTCGYISKKCWTRVAQANHIISTGTIWFFFSNYRSFPSSLYTFFFCSAFKNGVIVCGAGIHPPKGIDSGKYKELKTHLSQQPIAITHDDMSKLYLRNILKTVSVLSSLL